MYVISRNHLYQRIPKEEFLKISLSDREYLEAINKLKNPKISELAEEMKYTKTSVTNMVQKLEKNGYVKRIRSKSDKREVYVELTEKGHYIFEWKENMHEITISGVMEILTPQELETFEILLEKIAKEFDQELDIIYKQNEHIDKLDWPPLI
uniref:Transcriptional regulator, MarR family n=1 Tax=Methanococcus maripaludis (strain C6 / ATCC BAA-1332) TaxID=444158 RepID=A9A7L1_METM6